MNEATLSRRWPWLAAVAVVIGSYLAYLSTQFEIEIGDQDKRPVATAEDIEALADRDDINVLFILVDTLRADRLHSYGYERETSPTFDQLAERGVRFAHHLAQSSWTKCSMASLWTGLYPNRTGVTRFDHLLSEEAVLPAEIMSDAGFRTVGLYRNGWVEGYFGFDQGFDDYVRTHGSAAPASVIRENPTIQSRSTDASLIPSALEFLRVYGDERWFLYTHLMDLHEYLYDSDSAKFGTHYTDVYDNSILRVNLVVKELLNEIRRAGHLENTIVVIASDHGEAFSERGIEGHARKVYRETTEVPFILSFPFRLDPGIELTTRTANVDIWPTLLDVLGLPPMPDADGRSRKPEILAALRGEPVKDTGEISIAHLDQNWGKRDHPPAATVSIAKDRFRYVLHPETDKPRGFENQLFDRTADAAELSNVIEAEPEVAQQLREEIDRYLGTEPPWGGELETLEMDEMQLNQLRALGYKIP
ncbi:MAG: sulfatase [bacterium]|nr:sulfatase [bacterium]